MIRCPKCGSDKIAQARCIDGPISCMNCGHRVANKQIDHSFFIPDPIALKHEGHPSSWPAFKIVMDGDKFMAVMGNFINLEESPAGFGDTPIEALRALLGDAFPDEPVPVQSAQDLAGLCIQEIVNSNTPADAMVLVISLIESAFAAQRQAGRDEVREKLFASYAKNIRDLDNQYAAVVEALRGLVDIVPGDSDEIAAALKALSDLDELKQKEAGNASSS